MYRVVIVLCLLMMLWGSFGPSQAQPSGEAALAYVLANEVWLADERGNALYNLGLELPARQPANLFWSPDGSRLYIATRNGLYIASAEGSIAARLPGEFGLTMAIARHGGVLYNLDAENAQVIQPATEDSPALVAFPLRETNLANASGGRGRLINTIGRYDLSAGSLDVTHAALLYARDNGMVEAGRPHLWATYGNSLFYSCCFPGPGLGLLDVSSGENFPDYDPTFLPGAATLNDAASRLAGQTVYGTMHLIDLISGGSRDYPLEIPGGLNLIEAMAWALDDSAIYFAHRLPPQQPLEILPTLERPLDNRSAFVEIWRLDLVTGRVNRLTELGDIFGVSSMSATGDMLFMTVVERNTALIDAFNRGDVAVDASLNDPSMAQYMPRSLLYRYDLRSEQLSQVTENVWGVVARPR